MPEHRPVRERVLDATAAITVERGWAAVTMAKVAGIAEVSRQTVYNEYGVKAALGQAMVLREVDRFLTVVGHELDTHDDLVDAIHAAAEQTLRIAQGNPLLKRMLASAHSVSAGGTGAEAELLPFLTTDAEPLIVAAKEVVVARLDRFPDLGMTPAELDGAVDAIVRLVLSHVMQPGGAPKATADHLAWIVARVLGRDPADARDPDDGTRT
ncbi:MAG: TetR family transcriptional regulator [Nocardioidaceae bacterium]